MYKLDVIDGMDAFRGNIHTVFGTAVHEQAQKMLKDRSEVSFFE